MRLGHIIICQDAKQNNVGHLELRFAPQLHLGSGTDIETVVDIVLDAIGDETPLILCGLYGETPSILNKFVDIGINRRQVGGIDLAGGPIPSHRYSMIDYRDVFVRAKKHGIGRTVHAGEGRPPKEIATAILELEAQRIGHGTTLLQDEDVVELIRKRDVCIEACVTSNMHTGVIPSIAEHPICRWIEKGIKVSICTDNTLLSQVSAQEEYKRVSAIEGMSKDYVDYTIAAGRNAAFFR